MHCPGCRSEKVSTVETKTNKDGSVRRRVRCQDCGACWSIKIQVITDCPGCRSDKVLTQETTTNKDGSVRRRMQCRDCNASWSIKTEVTGDVTVKTSKPQRVPDNIRQAIAAAGSDMSNNDLAKMHGISCSVVHRIRVAAGTNRKPSGRQLLHHEVMQIKAEPSHISNAELAKQYGVDWRTIRRARAKVQNRKVAAGPAQAINRSCHDCQHWWANHGRCSFEFPESLAEGPQYAAECDMYAPAPVP